MTATFDAFAARARQGGAMVPVTRQVVLDGDTPVSAFAKLHRGPYGFLLESLDDTLSNPEKVEHYLRLPNLALVPDFDKMNGIGYVPAVQAVFPDRVEFTGNLATEIEFAIRAQPPLVIPVCQ